jgi:hypothetical protein
MGVAGTLGRFVLIYFVINIIAGMVLSFFNISSNIGVGVGILTATIFLVCTSFAKKNRRYFMGSEKAKIVTGFIIINIFLQLIFALPAFAERGPDANANTIIYFLGFILIGHSLLIYFFVGLAKKTLVKQGVIHG